MRNVARGFAIDELTDFAQNIGIRNRARLFCPQELPSLRQGAFAIIDEIARFQEQFGVDLGYTSGGVIVWAVFAPSSDVRPGALQGDYAGASASAAVGVGVGANVLVGGLDKSIALQPVSLEGMTGLNVAAGIGAIRLTRPD